MTGDDAWFPLDDKAGPAPRLSAARADALIAAALDRAAVAPDADEAPTAELPPRRARYKRWAWLAVALVLVTSGVSAAVSVAVSRVAVREVEPAGPRRVRSVEPAPVVEPEPESKSEPEPEPGPESEAEPESSTDAPVEAGADRRVGDARPALDLLERANRARRDRQWRRADALYERVRKRHPRSQAAYVAAVSSAAIKLDQLGDARGALALYRQAARRAPGGALAEEADFGIAEAHRQLGNRTAERRALERFARRHPASLLADRARERAARLSDEELSEP